MFSLSSGNVVGDIERDESEGAYSKRTALTGKLVHLGAIGASSNSKPALMVVLWVEGMEFEIAEREGVDDDGVHGVENTGGRLKRQY